MDVIAVVGTCSPERRKYARRLAAEHRWSLVKSLPAPLDRTVALWGTDIVLDLASDAEVTDVIGSLADDPVDVGTRLVGIVCIIDAAHLLIDLRSDTARVTVSQLEFASTIVLVNWSGLDTPHLSMVMALTSHLAPSARLRLDRIRPLGTEPDIRDSAPYTSAQDRAGWVQLLNGEFDPHMTDARVSGFTYEQVRPLHPARLKNALDRIDEAEFGIVVRSAGFCRLATRPDRSAHWDHAGREITFSPLAPDGDDELTALGQEIALIGVDINRSALVQELDGAALTDKELAEGPRTWARYPDPLPEWTPSADHAE